MRRVLLLCALVLALAAAGCTSSRPVATLTWGDIATLPQPRADHRIEYGPDPLHFGELRLPGGPGPHPVAVVIHGGCWRSQYDLQHVASASAALVRAGTATWTIEYRRLGDPGGGWPGTLQDVGRGIDYLATIAEPYSLDLRRVVLVGHSAGGHLALWAAARHKQPPDSPLFSSTPLPVAGVVSLAGITDLRTFGAAPGSCNAAVAPLLGGSPAEVPTRYVQANPVDLLPLGVPTYLVHGLLDPVVPVEQSRSFHTRARAAGDDSVLWLVEGAGHFEPIAPRSAAWPHVERAVRSLVAARRTAADPRLTRPHSGVGPGMAIGSDGACRMGGDLAARVTLGAGSAFTPMPSGGAPCGAPPPGLGT